MMITWRNTIIKYLIPILYVSSGDSDSERQAFGARQLKWSFIWSQVEN